MKIEEATMEIAREVEEYLKNFFNDEMERVLNDLCNCEPVLEKFLQIQARLKAIRNLQKQILIDKSISYK